MIVFVFALLCLFICIYLHTYWYHFSCVSIFVAVFRHSKTLNHVSLRQLVKPTRGNLSCLSLYLLFCIFLKTLLRRSMNQGWTPRAVGRGGFPAPPRPVKMIKTTEKLWGKIKARISTFSNRGNKWWNNITTLNNAQSSLSIGYARESKKWKYLLIFLLTGN